MTIHDAYARLTPYELTLPGRDFVEDHFPRIGEEDGAANRGRLDPVGFSLLGSVRETLGNLITEEVDDTIIREYAFLLFHLFRFWEEGESLYLLTEGAARSVVSAERARAADGGRPPGSAASSAEGGSGRASLPASAGYLQLPRYLFWSRSAAADDRPPEAIDGLFWSVDREGALSTLITAGLLQGEGGLTIVPAPTVPREQAEAARRMAAREDEPDFYADLPGGEIDELLAVETAAEALKLLLGTFDLIDTGGAEVVGAQPPAEEPPEGPIPTALPYRRIEVRAE